MDMIVGIETGTVDRPARRKLWTKKGFTALELGVTLAILGLLASGVGYYTGPLQDKRRYQKFQADTTLLVSSADGAYQGAFGTTAPTVANLIGDGAVPESVVVAGALVDAWGGGITYTPNTATAFWDQDLIPQKYCRQFLLSLPPTTQNVAVGAAATVAALGAATTYAPPVSEANAATACAAATNAVRLQFK